MTSLSEGKTQFSPVGHSQRASTGPSAGFLIDIGQENVPYLRFDPDVPKSRVALTEAGDIRLDWGHEDTEATLFFKPPKGAQIQSLSVGWLVDDLHSYEPKSLPFHAVSPAGGHVILTMTRDPQYATYACYFAVKQGDTVHRHDPKIYNEVPPDETR